MTKAKAVIARVTSLADLRFRAAHDERYRKLLHAAADNLGGDTKGDDARAYRWLELNAQETTESGVVREVNACRDLVS